MSKMIALLRRARDALVIAQAMIDPENQPPQFSATKALRRINAVRREVDQVLKEEDDAS